MKFSLLLLESSSEAWRVQVPRSYTKDEKRGLNSQRFFTLNARAMMGGDSKQLPALEDYSVLERQLHDKLAEEE